jgi:hypothetical protein
MTRIARSGLALVLTAVVGGLVGCGDNKAAIPTKLDQQLPPPPVASGGGPKAKEPQNPVGMAD